MSRSNLAKSCSWIVVAGTAVAACSSSTDPGGSGAAALVIASGDGQTAVAGTALPVALSVVVRNAAGATVAGVVVSFSVDSGGGSIAAASASSGADGIAVAGIWTLGPAAGAGVITARASGYASVRFHAQALGGSARPVITGTTASSGGTLTFNKPGDPLDGLTVTVPAGSYPTATQWTIMADSSVHVALPTGFTQAGPALVVSNAQGYSDSTMTITVPMTVPSSVVVAPFYFDPATGTLEGIPLVGRTATNVTLAARHFSSDLVAIRGRAAAGLRASSRFGFGDVQIVWVQIPQTDLVGTYSSAFQVGVDTWEFANLGDYISPGGICEGMTITEMYYYYYVASGGRPHLYHHFDVSLANRYDNVQGIRWSGSVQGDVATNPVDQIGTLWTAGTKNGGVDPGTLTANWIALTLKLTHQPVLVALQGVAGLTRIAHAVIAYSVTVTGVETDVSIADPNQPTTPRIMTFAGGASVDPFPFSDIPGGLQGTIRSAYALGVSAEVPLGTLASRYSDFVSKQAGHDKYPAKYTFEMRDSVNQEWDSLPDTVRTTTNNMKFRLRCPDCTVHWPGADPADLQLLQVLNDSATLVVADVGVPVNVAPGTIGLVAKGGAASPFATPPENVGFLDMRNFTLIYGKLDIVSDALHGRPTTKYTFATTPGPLATPASKFIWDFNDGTRPSTIVGDTTITHTFDEIGIYRPSVQLLDRDGKLIGADTVTAIITHDVWQLTSSVVSSILPAGGIGTSPVDTITQETVDDVLGGLGAAQLFRVDSANCSGAVIELGSYPDTGLVAGSERGVFASNCGGFGGSFQMGTLGSGTLSGSVNRNVVPNSVLFSDSRGMLDATMNGSVLSGTLTWIVAYSGGDGTYTIQFTATQVQPIPGPPGTLRAKRQRSP